MIAFSPADTDTQDLDAGSVQDFYVIPDRVPVRIESVLLTLRSVNYPAFSSIPANRSNSLPASAAKNPAAGSKAEGSAVNMGW